MAVPFVPALADAALAHPLTQPHGLPVAPHVAAIAGAATIVVVGLIWPSTGRPPPDQPPMAVDSWEGTLRAPQVATRAVAGALLILAIAAGRLGSEIELENIAPALVVGTAWPLLLLASAAVGSVWRWIDPWDGAARLLERGEPGTETATDVRWAVIPALAWVWYVAAYPNSLSPRAVGTALALYTIVTVMGCLAVGRTVWMSRVEVFGLLFGWATRLPLGRLGVWRPPRGTELVLGVLGGGFLFGSIRGSELWGALNVGPLAGLLATIGLVATCTLAAATLTALARRASRRGVPGSVAAAAVPMVVAVGLNLAMARGRLLVSIQLLPRLAGDPFGRGWDLFGTGGGLPPSSPLGPEALAATQVAILMVGGIVGAIVAGMRTSRAVRGPALAGVTLLGAGAVLAISAT